MSVAAHQRYGEFVDEHVFLDTLEFNAKAHYAILPGLDQSLSLTRVPEQRLAALVARDVSVADGARRIEVPFSPRAQGDWRAPSARRFDGTKALQFDAVQALVSAALMAQPEGPGLARMPYASGGALYPVQTFICRTGAGVFGWPDTEVGMQVMPFSRCLESLNLNCSASFLLEALSGGSADSLGEPHFALVYAILLDKALFKYRYRGFRLAQMEVGSMYQRVTEEANARGLCTRVWAGFSDHRVAAVLGLDATYVLPMVVQFVGY